MKALRRFSVRPTLPPSLASLERLAMNLRWSWDVRTRDLFRWVDPEAWEANQHDPMRLLVTTRPERFTASTSFLPSAIATLRGFSRYTSNPAWRASIAARM